MTTPSTEDTHAIKALIQHQFDNLSWTPESPGKWNGFVADFYEGARLYPSSRPVSPAGVDEFVTRMQSLAKTSLRTFDEHVTGTKVVVFGNVAIAAAGVEIAENDNPPSRSAEMMLLLKEDETWKIVAQAWDTEARAGQLLPKPLLDRDDSSQ